MQKNILKYAIDLTTNRGMFINEVPNGLSCNCKCELCDSRLEAIQGEKNEWHFRHYDKTNCIGAQETAIHKRAKQIIVENVKILTPRKTLVYSEARQEERFGSFIPDVTVLADDENVFFEIVVRNPVNVEKESFYKNGHHKSIEINISDIPYNITPEELEMVIINRTYNKREIFWEIPTLIIQDSPPLKEEPKSLNITNEVEKKVTIWNHPITIIAGVFGGGYILYRIFRFFFRRRRRL